MTATETAAGPARTLVRGGLVLTMDPSLGILPEGDVAIENGRITDVGAGLDPSGAEVIDASDMVVIPGLVDSHWHMWSSLGRNFIREGYEYFPAKLATSAHYEPEDFYNSVRLGLLEALNAGITTVHNWSHNTRTPEHADAELRAHRDVEIRARYAYGHIDGLALDTPLDFTDIDRVRKEWFGEQSPYDGRVHLGINLRGPDLADDAVFHVEMEQARSRDLPVAIHTVQGGHTEVNAADLARHGYLGPDLLICHFIAATAEDRRLMAQTDTSLSYAVHSELRLGDAGDPRAALLQMVADGVNVSLSIDATSLHPINLFEAMNVAWNMGIPWEGSPTADLAALTFAQVLAMGTVNGGRALGLGDQIGSLSPGKQADLLLLRRHDLNVAPVVDPESTVVRSVTPANVDTVLVGGAVVKRGGQLVGADVPAAVAAAEESAARVLERASRA